MKKLIVLIISGWYFFFYAILLATEPPFTYLANGTLIELERSAIDASQILKLAITPDKTANAEIFALGSPSRIVIDLKGLSINKPYTLSPTVSSTINKIRLGNHPGKVRIVLDFTTPFVPKFDIDDKKSTITLLIKEQEPLDYTPNTIIHTPSAQKQKTAKAAKSKEQQKTIVKPTPPPTPIDNAPHVIGRGRIIARPTPPPDKPTATAATPTLTPTPPATQKKRQPAPTATSTSTASPSATQLPVSTPRATSTPTQTVTPTATATATTPPTTTPTTTPSPTATTVKKSPTPTATARSHTSLITHPALLDLAFQRDPKDSLPAVRLRLNRRLNFQVRKQHDERYQVIISNCQLAFKRLSLPLFPPRDFSNFTMVVADATGSDVMVSIGIERGTRVNYFAVGNEIWIKSLNPEK